MASRTTRPANPAWISKRAMRQLPKILLHEHLDCSLKIETMLELWDKLDFSFANVRFPQATLDFWSATGFDISTVAFPTEIIQQWRHSDIDSTLTGRARATAIRRCRRRAVRLYRQFLQSYARASLANYVNAVVVHILPLMQSEQNLRRITKERIAAAVKDGIVAMELRFAPQLHTWHGLTLDQVMKAVTESVAQSPIPVHLILCALRHEPGAVDWEVANLCRRYRRTARVLDLAADEKAFPGVLMPWIKAAVLALVSGLALTIHLWETNEPTAEDLELLALIGTVSSRVKARLKETPCAQLEQLIDECLAEALCSLDIKTSALPSVTRIGHGFRGNLQGERFLEICPTSNVVTGQLDNLAQHPIDRLLREGKKVTVNTDGLTLTGLSGLTDEYEHLQETFNWGLAELLQVNLNAVDASSFSKHQKGKLRALLRREYRVR